MWLSSCWNINRNLRFFLIVADVFIQGNFLLKLLLFFLLLFWKGFSLDIIISKISKGNAFIEDFIGRIYSLSLFKLFRCAVRVGTQPNVSTEVAYLKVCTISHDGQLPLFAILDIGDIRGIQGAMMVL